MGLDHFFPVTHCTYMWTGGWTNTPGTDPLADNWKWITSFSDVDPAPITYMDWALYEPNNNGGSQPALALSINKDYKYVDLSNTAYGNTCYVCECP